MAWQLADSGADATRPGIFCLCFMLSLGSILANQPCPSQSNGLKCDYIGGITHDNSKMADEGGSCCGNRDCTCVLLCVLLYDCLFLYVYVSTPHVHFVSRIGPNDERLSYCTRVDLLVDCVDI